MAANKRLVYFLVFLVIALPVITGILVWKLLPGCDDKTNTAESGRAGSQVQPTASGVQTVPTSAPLQTTNSTLSGKLTTPPFEDGPWKTLRLPGTVLPVHYNLTMFPDFYDNASTFYGNVSIELQVKEATQLFMVHVLFLDIAQTKLLDGPFGNAISIKRTFEYKPNQFWVVETTKPILANSTVYLDIQFSGSLNRSIVGFYKSTYINSITKKPSSIATTKFEPVNARRAFPCLDEPNIKATYTVTLVHRKGYTALSNMPVQWSDTWSQNPSLVATRFDTSVKMSTYLACFIVCDFSYLEGNSTSGIKVRLYAPPDRVNQTAYALQVAMTSVDLYTTKFNISYPLPKLDLISVPDFVSGAMENWGLITFRETNILVDPSAASDANKQNVAGVVAHEVSHQWFGNLVTMDWWDDLWLNEGFASFMEYIGAATQEPTWDMISQRLIIDVQPVMVTDAGVSSHPIVVDVTDPNDINAVFDIISYSKGMSVIGMLERWMGSDRFFEGISRYLHKYQYSNARTDDLWTALGNIADDIRVKDVMDTWTKQMGLPYLNVTIVDDVITVQQDRFLADQSIHYDISDSHFGYKWFIKLDYMIKTKQTYSVWIKGNRTLSFTTPQTLNSSNPDFWLKFNLDGIGFYRVNYPVTIWRRLSDVLRKDTKVLTPADRANLIDDAFNLARAGLLGYDIALDMTSYLDAEQDYLPWESATSGLSYIAAMLEFTGDYELLQQYKVAKVTGAFNRLGWDDTGSHLDKLLRSTVISLACGNGHEDCMRTAKQKFQDWLYKNATIPPNIRSLVYNYGMGASDSSRDWHITWQRYLNEADAQEKSKLQSALAKTKSIPLLMRYIENAQNEEYVRSQDYFNVLGIIAGNRAGRGLVWDWVRNNWQTLVDRFTLYSRYFGRLLPSIASNFNTQYQLEEVQMFFAKYPDAGAGASGRKQVLESIQRNIRWMATNKQRVVTWLESHVPKEN
ncbi:glutamyl aminopeptidase-like [Dreissena polymorpha]|uniref:Aminopeptidase n=1 Tax=Dreissena polymorpha TaxID=45954 RepID=A0A9D4RE70_DREPO|nr:glutamyl aminopeptidase-like [Dreissena polymorpha]KAH3863357.1 hypothetical protein DPMN_026342 [Dreissena polymorpha]